ncbi:putative ATPase of the ABC class [Clostridium tepidiprofundi DSM 19306]|uniref:Putative ATPase of the ABC class n=1 Tax=Clostridium tepidiprofundi DSM 19306 TaxID=1121338 RepID=A0A151B524_9CLOT|nr:ABC-ATPase domain-containing protein [Clostridium tepidiprofundi]KYH34862.1 putative ATPase of the ABC class [Clostridium tepidiprofundi DSM 19306]
MKNKFDLLNELKRINGKGYKAYKDIQGMYEFDKYILSIDYVQGDPFASPSRIRVIIKQKYAGFPYELFDKEHKKIAVVDHLTRLFYSNLIKYYNRISGSGKSGLISIDVCGQEILDRTSIFINKEKVEVRLEIGLPASGRRILADRAEDMLLTVLPSIIEKTLFYNNINKKALIKHIQLIEDQVFIREQLKQKKLIAFIADGAILPRESGVSDKPMKKGSIPFKSPESLKKSFDLPNRGEIIGMAIPEGVTLIVGGGYHGKSTLLKALELGVYNHIEGDGREFVITEETAVKIRAEDGRRIEKVNITPFITNLPNGKDTYKFCTENASGSTSQAANIMEAIEINSKVLLIDEDTSATNFMIRDKKMQRLVNRDKEPITPFIDRVRSLYNKNNISTIVVVGSSGEYFNKADTVIMMDEYIPKDVTDIAKKIANNTYEMVHDSNDDSYSINNSRVVLKSSFSKEYKGVKLKTRGLNTIIYNKDSIELNYVEQLVHSSQTKCIANIIYYIMNNIVDNKKNMSEIVNEVYSLIKKNGLEVVSSYKGHPGNMALPRKFEIAATLNRFRNLHIK